LFCECYWLLSKKQASNCVPKPDSGMRLIPHDDSWQAPELPDDGLVFLEQMECVSSPEAILHSSDDRYFPQERTSEPKWFNQQELNDLIPDISLSRDKAELLASRLKERNLLKNDVRVCHYWIWNNVLKACCRVNGPMAVCHISVLCKGQYKNMTYQIDGFSSALFSEIWKPSSIMEIPNLPVRSLTLYT
jgi:hypothetical protein